MKSKQTQDFLVDIFVKEHGSDSLYIVNVYPGGKKVWKE